MAWSEQWDYSVDGTDINEGVLFRTVVPEIDNQLRGEMILVPVEGDIDWFVRVQPASGLFTFNVQMTPCTSADWATRLAILNPLFAPGPHTFVAQARGMTSAKTWTIYCDGGTIADYKTRRFTAVATVLAQV